MPAATLPPTLHFHPLSSYCHKALIAIDELGAAVERRLYNPGDPAERAAFLALCPTGKMPLLVDDGRPVFETSILIEHLQRHHAAEGKALIPSDPEAALQVRLWDRLSDLYLMTPMQAFTDERLRQPGERDPLGTVRARPQLLAAYAMFDRQLAAQAAAGCDWLAGSDFSLADCAAEPALFYARAYVPVPAEHVKLIAYFERLQLRPSVARTIDGARPYFGWFPGRDGLERRFFDPAA